jgi:hypothetical protein
MVGALEATGAIDEIADGIGDLTGGDRTAELLGIAWVSVIGSALVDNIPFTAAMIPVVDQLQAGNGGDAYWWALAIGACFGGNATLIAAAANVAAAGMAARAGRPIGFLTFLKVGVPATLVSMVLASGLPALPVVGPDGRLAGLFGEREFMTALFPGYIEELHYAGFVPGVLDEALDRRAACAREPVSRHMNRDHVAVGEDFRTSASRRCSCTTA